MKYRHETLSNDDLTIPNGNFIAIDLKSTIGQPIILPLLTAIYSSRGSFHFVNSDVLRLVLNI